VDFPIGLLITLGGMREGRERKRERERNRERERARREKGRLQCIL
jgi:hypothetical protein